MNNVQIMTVVHLPVTATRKREVFVFRLATGQDVIVGYQGLDIILSNSGLPNGSEEKREQSRSRLILGNLIGDVIPHSAGDPILDYKGEAIVDGKGKPVIWAKPGHHFGQTVIVRENGDDRRLRIAAHAKAEAEAAVAASMTSFSWGATAAPAPVAEPETVADDAKTVPASKV